MIKDKGLFKTIDKIYGPIEFKEKKSRFISFAFPVVHSIEADTIIKAMRKRYHDCNHVCFAYRLGNGAEDYFRYSDDGEPSGTAGIPIYNELKGAGLFNVMVMVIRYFGGTKLGTGGLARAYSRGARDVIGISEIIVEEIKKRVEIDIDFELTGEIMKMVDRFSIKIVDQSFNDNGINMILEIPETSYMKVREYIKNVTKGIIII